MVQLQSTLLCHIKNTTPWTSSISTVIHPFLANDMGYFVIVCLPFSLIFLPHRSVPFRPCFLFCTLLFSLSFTLLYLHICAMLHSCRIYTGKLVGRFVVNWNHHFTHPYHIISGTRTTIINLKSLLWVRFIPKPWVNIMVHHFII